jgi:hypothetical protein
MTDTTAVSVSETAPMGGQDDTPTADTGAGLLADAKIVADTAKPDGDNDGLGSHLAEDPAAAAKAAELAKRERPEWLPEKFWDAEKKEPRTEQVAKSYAELEKQFKLGKHKPPKDGKYDLTPFADKVSSDDPLMGKYTEWAAKHGLSQSAYEELVGQVVELAGGAQAEAQINAKAEREALGANADAIIGSMTEWARGFVRSGVWSAEDFEEFKIMGGTAQGMKALMKVRESYEGRIPLQQTVVDTDMPTREDLDAMIADPRYLKEPAFRDKVTKGFEKLAAAGMLG